MVLACEHGCMHRQQGPGARMHDGAQAAMMPSWHRQLRTPGTCRSWQVKQRSGSSCSKATSNHRRNAAGSAMAEPQACTLSALHTQLGQAQSSCHLRKAPLHC